MELAVPVLSRKCATLRVALPLLESECARGSPRQNGGRMSWRLSCALSVVISCSLVGCASEEEDVDSSSDELS